MNMQYHWLLFWKHKKTTLLFITLLSFSVTTSYPSLPGNKHTVIGAGIAMLSIPSGIAAFYFYKKAKDNKKYKRLALLCVSASAILLIGGSAYGTISLIQPMFKKQHKKRNIPAANETPLAQALHQEIKKRQENEINLANECYKKEKNTIEQNSKIEIKQILEGVVKEISKRIEKSIDETEKQQYLQTLSDIQLQEIQIQRSVYTKKEME